jgi:hypothetical protein
MDMRKGASVAAIVCISLLLIPQQIIGESSERSIEVRYHTSFEIASILENASMDNPGIAEFTTAQDFLGTRDIIGGRVIPILFMGNRSDDRPWIMLIGAHHGDEPDSAEAVLAFSMHLLDSYNGGDPRALRIAEGLNIAILPVVNPYGLDMLTRVDENGEDPNRDYPFEPAGVSQTTDGIPLTTAGADAIHELASMYPFSMAISFHTGSKGVFYPWGAPNTGVESPDHNAFSAIGSELSRASGQKLLHGPANDFPYVANLSGAFDDHLYGSMFLGDQLYSPEMKLPWSIYTATVELESVKGNHPENLGGLEDLWDDPISDTGTVPMGVRICYSACQMVKPELEVNHTYDNGNLHVRASVIGAVGLSDTGFLIDGEETGFDIEWTGHPYLPEYTLEFDIETQLEAGYHSISFSTKPDEDWSSKYDDSNPQIIPQSIVSRSREGLDLTWTDTFYIQGDPPGPSDPTINASIEFLDEDLVWEVSENSWLDLSLNWTGEDPEEVVIIMELNEWTTVSKYSVGQFVKGNNSLPFDIVPMKGEANITVNLSFSEGDLVRTTKANILPGVEIMSAEEEREVDNKWRIMVGVSGGTGPTPLIWGVSRNPRESWETSGWSIPPGVVISEGYGPEIITVDLSGFDGTHYFRVIAADALDHFPYWMEKSRILYPQGDVTIPDISYYVDNDTLKLGPGLVISRMNGLEVLDPYTNDIVYEVTLSGPDGNSTPLKLVWKHDPWLSDKEKNDLEYMLLKEGFSGDEVQGAFFGEIDLPDEKGDYRLFIEINGKVGVGEAMYEDISLESEVGPFHIGEWEDEDGDDDNRFPWILFIFLIIVAFVILIVSYLRYDSHGREPVPDEEEEGTKFRKYRKTGERPEKARKVPPPPRTLRVVDRNKKKDSSAMFSRGGQGPFK